MSQDSKEVYVHVTLIVLDEKRVRVGTEVMEYTEQEASLRCETEAHRGSRRKLFQSVGSIKCSDCVPWGNHRLSKQYVPVGRSFLFLTCLAA